MNSLLGSTLNAPRPSWPSLLTQMYPPSPSYTEKDIPDLLGKVYIVTGSNTGIGKAVANILYSKNAKVYVAARSEEKALNAVTEIKADWPNSKGQLIYLHLDLADLNSVRAAAEEFKSRETKLHVLFNNAAVQALGDTDTISHTVQGHEIHLGVNLLGPFLFTKLLTQKLLDTVKAEPADSGIVRVVWVSSLGTEVVGEKSYGLTTNYLDYHTTMSPLERYGMTKAGNWLHAVEFARRHRDDGIISMPCNPGHLKTDLYRDGGQMAKAVLSTIALYAPIFGAYTELYCATSPDITLQQSGDWVIPWGRFNPIRADLLEATKSEVEGGNGNAQKFWEWCEKQIAEFL